MISTVDGLPMRDSGPWAADKLYYVDRYMRIFTTGMKHQWADLAFVDLMAGPGRCYDRESGKEFDGSPLLAAAQETPFTQIVCIEMDAENCAALKSRLGVGHILKADCNDPTTIDQVRALVPATALTLCFVDNLGLTVTYDTLRRLTDGRKIDLLITFQINDLTRNFELARRGDAGHDARLDAFFGTSSWRDLVAPSPADLTELYMERLGTLGFPARTAVHRLMKNSKNAPLYRLLLASRHQRAVDFFNKIKVIEHDGQRGLPLG